MRTTLTNTVDDIGQLLVQAVNCLVVLPQLFIILPVLSYLAIKLID